MGDRELPPSPPLVFDMHTTVIKASLNSYPKVLSYILQAQIKQNVANYIQLVTPETLTNVGQNFEVRIKACLIAVVCTSKM